ncbi:MAG: lysylphosphatidylglycerol synthase transmembrane domain-containing protein [Conexivisphaera sp.]
MRNVWRITPPVIGIAALGVAIYLGGPFRIAAALERADPLLLAIATGTESLAIVLTGLAWHNIIGGISPRPRAVDSIKATGLEIFVDATIPTGSVGGELLRITYAYNKMGISVWNSLAAAVVLRVMVAGVLSSLLAAAAYMGLAHLSEMWILLVASLAAIAIISVVAAFPSKIAKLAPGRYRTIADAVLGPISKALRSRGAIIALALVAAEIMSSAATQMLAFSALGARIPYYFVLAAYPIYDVLVALPTGIPGSFGVADVGTSLIYASFGVGWPTALAAMISTRVVCLIADAALGLPTFLTDGRHMAPPSDLRGMLSSLRSGGSP